MYSAERQFVTTAHSQLRLLGQDALHPHQIFEDALCQIKNAAGPVKARAIYRAALLCEDVLKRCDTATSIKFQTSLNSLKSLVELYASGLHEIDPGFTSIPPGEDKPATPIGLHETSLETSLEISPASKPNQLKADNENAAKLLKPLLHLVKDTQQTDALSLLAGFGRHLENTEITPPPTPRSSIRFDGLMRRITNRTLGAARAQAKNISISYAADFETVDSSISPHLEGFLQSTCLEIVHNGLVVNGDLAASLNRTWQISITGETRGADLSISLNWQGQQLLDFGKSGENGKGKEKLQNLDGKLSVGTMNRAQGELDMHVIELICPAKKSTNSDLVQMDNLQQQAREA